MIVASNLTVRYGSKVALSNLTMSLSSSGRICGLFGPNGAGKTTLINTLVGDINRYEGKVSRPKRSKIAYLPDKPFLYPWMTIRQCFDLFSERYTSFDRNLANTIIDGFGLNERNHVAECSKGMSERLHLALIIARSVPYYIFDEPLAAVDPFTRDFLIEMIKTTRRPDSTALISTHLISDVEQLFDDVMMISDGKLIYYGDAEELRQKSGMDLEGGFKKMVADYV